MTLSLLLWQPVPHSVVFRLVLQFSEHLNRIRFFPRTGVAQRDHVFHNGNRQRGDIDGGTHDFSEEAQAVILRSQNPEIGFIQVRRDTLQVVLFVDQFHFVLSA